MILNDMEFCRVAAFLDGLQLAQEKPELNGEDLKAIQEYTVERSNQYALRMFPDLSFLDETEREGTQVLIVADPPVENEWEEPEREPTPEELIELEQRKIAA